MYQIKKKIDALKLLKWVFLCFLSVAFLAGLGSNQSLKLTTSATNIQPSLLIHKSAKNNYDFNASLQNDDFHAIGLEIEQDEDEERDYSSWSSSQFQLLAIGFSAKPCVSFFPSLNTVKLFILFHSWKSFL
jgi:hypothetical protein